MPCGDERVKFEGIIYLFRQGSEVVAYMRLDLQMMLMMLSMTIEPSASHSKFRNGRQHGY
jgi:hypothetical protein